MNRLRPLVYKGWLNPFHEHNQLLGRREDRPNHRNGQEAREAPEELNMPEIENANAAEAHRGNPNPTDTNNEDEDYLEAHNIIEDEEMQPERECDGLYCQENSSRDDFVYRDTQTYAEKLELNEKLHPALDVTKFEVLIMILTLAMRHGFTVPLVTDLLGFVNKIIGRDAVPFSYHIFQKLFCVDSALTYHFICEHCNLYLGKYGDFESSEIACPNCNTQCYVNPHTLNETSFFVTLSLKNQMQDLVDRTSMHIMSRVRDNDGAICDIQDGDLYQSLSGEGMPLSNPNSLTLTIATDGGQVFAHSVRNSLWPIQIVCNEVCPTERFRPENMMLAGLWFGKSAPDMSAFLKPLSDELKGMEEHGVRRILHGEEISCPVFVILCVCDSVAKPKVQNISQFNAYHGCGYCMQRGEYIEECSQIRFPFNGNEYNLRAHQSMKEAMTLADATAQAEKGVKGLSPLLHFPTVHLVFGIPIDWLHCILLGVVKRLVGLWLDESSHRKRYYIKRHEAELDRRLSQITAPSRLVTRPKIISKRSIWKGKDWLAFLLYFGIPSLNNLLPDVYLKNFKDLSNGIFNLLKDSITQGDLDESLVFLHRFVLTYNNLYGVQNMVYNVHLITHLVQVVKMTGPLQMCSAFSFEGGMGLLVKLVKGTNSVSSQICRKYMAAKSLPYILSFHDISDTVQEFCESILTFKTNKTSLKIADVTLLGGEKLSFLSQKERQLIIGDGFPCGEFVSSFNRAIYKGQVYTSTNYSRPTKTNDTCIQLISGRFGIIDLIWITQQNEVLFVVLLFVRMLRVPEGYEISKYVSTCAGNPYEDTVILRFPSILRKGIFFSVGDYKYVTYRPNTIERD